ncbi:Inositol phosphatase SIW14 [Naganishia albida]|nr:Inositol phosphatase SIW14 [Naganishia albida]
MDTLARYRTINARQSEHVVRLGREILQNGTKLGNQEWAVREQIAVAALDTGDRPLAESQIALLSSRFPSSPRLLILQALHLESRGKYTSAKIIYHALLGKKEGVVVEGGDDGAEGRRVVQVWKGESDECLVTAHQRLITLALYPPPQTLPSTTNDGPTTTTTTPTPTPASIAAAIPLLVEYLATFHQDPDAWSLLADLYLVSTPTLSLSTSTSSGWGIDALWNEGKVVRAAAAAAWVAGGRIGEGYVEHALECLAQRVLVEPWEWKVLVRFAEIGILHGDIPFAYKTLLRAVEMSSVPYPGANDPRATEEGVHLTEGMAWNEVVQTGGWKTRAWWDLAACCTALGNSSAESTLGADPPTKLDAVTELVRLRLDALTGRKGVVDGVLREIRG